MEVKRFIAIGESKYGVSYDGEVLNTKTLHILKQSTDKVGYKYVTLYHDGKTKKHRVHRLVALNWLPPRKGMFNLEVNHKDGNKSNNDYTNLEWVTKSENHIHAFRNGLKKLPHTSKLNEKKVRQIRKYLEHGWSQKRIAEKYNVAQGTVSAIKCGRNWGWLV